MKSYYAIAALVALSANDGAASSSSRSSILGRWTGVSHEVSSHFRYDFPVDIEIFERNGVLMLKDHDRRRMSQPAAPLKLVNNAYVATITSDPWGSADISLSLVNQAIDYSIVGGSMAAVERNVARLHRGASDIRRYDTPRLDTRGRQVTQYRYVAPRPGAEDLPVSTARDEGFDIARLEAAVNTILSEKKDGNGFRTESLQVMRHGKLVLDEYFWGQSAANPHMISSCAKSVTSILAGVAWDRGSLKLDTRMTDYFPNYKAARWATQAYPITVRNVLSMTSGTAWDDTHADGAPSVALLKTDDVARYMMDTPLVANPGSLYNYNNGLPALAGLAVGRAAGTSFDTLANNALFKPLKIMNYRWTQMREGGALGAGGLYLTPRAMTKLGEMMRSDGIWRGRRVISAAWVKESTAQQTPRNGYPYGFYWHLNSRTNQVFTGPDGFMALGQGGQLIAVFPSLDMVVAATSSNWQRQGYDAMPKQIIDLVISAARPDSFNA